MIFKLFRRSANQTVIERLHAAIVAAARQPALFTALGLSDTFEGRFESLTLQAALVLRRLNALPAPGPEIAQDLIDTIFQHFDRMLREMGIGDTTVPKRMKGLAEAFLGRSAAYDEALRAPARDGQPAGDVLRQALARNVFAGPASRDQALALGRYVEAVVTALDALSVQDFVDGNLPCPDPAPFAAASPDRAAGSIREVSA